MTDDEQRQMPSESQCCILWRCPWLLCDCQRVGVAPTSCQLRQYGGVGRQATGGWRGTRYSGSLYGFPAQETC